VTPDAQTFWQGVAVGFVIGSAIFVLCELLYDMWRRER